MAVLHPPVEMALARAEKQVPTPSAARPLAFEIKLDGYRGLLFSGEGVLQSRNGNNLAARFPELLTAATDLGDVVLDGEIVAYRDGRLDFGALAGSPRNRAASGAVVYYVAFDLLAEGDRDYRSAANQDRRARLEQLMTRARPPLQLVTRTTNRDEAMDWMQPHAAALGIEGVVVKRLDRPYRAGRSDWIKVRSTVVVDAVTIGATGDLTAPTELVLARPEAAGPLRRIGLSLPLRSDLRVEAGRHLISTGDPPKKIFSGLFGASSETEYYPVRPTLVVEILAEASVLAFTNRQRPQVHRLRLDLTPDDLALRI